MTGRIVWGLLIAAVAGWELAGQRSDRIPTLGDVVRMGTARFRLARWMLFGFWLWVGWHFIIRYTGGSK